MRETNELDQLLRSSREQDIDRFLREEIGDLPYIGFRSYMDAMIAQKGLKRRDILQRADFPQSYGYKLLTGERHTIQRDYILRLCLACRMTRQETDRALRLYGMSPLYARSPRDAVLLFGWNQRLDIDELNDLLERHGQLPLISYGDEG